MSADPAPDPVAVLKRAEEKDLLPAQPGAGKQPPRPPIIVFGDYNLSFSTTLLREDGDNGHLHATIYEDPMVVDPRDKKLPEIRKACWEKLQNCGANVHHSVDATNPETWPIKHPAVIHFNLPWRKPQPHYKQDDLLQKFVLQVFLVAESQQQTGDKFYMIVQVSAKGIDFYQKWYNLGEVVTKTGYRITNFAKPPAYEFFEGDGNTVALYQIEFTLRPAADKVKQGRSAKIPSTWYKNPSGATLIWDVPESAMLAFAAKRASTDADAEAEVEEDADADAEAEARELQEEASRSAAFK